MTTAPLLRVHDLSLAIKGKAIISGIAFAMRAGEIRAVVGPNGAGKSTLARCVAGIARPTGGGVEVDGRRQDQMPRRELARNICYMPQFQGGLPAYSVRDYVMMGRYAHTGFWDGLGRDDGRAADAAMELAGVRDLSDRLLPTLSGGERQLVAIAAGLAQEARLLILDEPATFLDPGHQDLLLDLIRRLNRERGLSILVVTHDVNMAMLFTHRTLALRAGRAVYDGMSVGLAEPGVLRNIYGMDFAFVDDGDRRFAMSAGMMARE